MWQRMTGNRKPSIDDTKEIGMNRLKTIYTLAFATILAGAAGGCADLHGSQSASADSMITADVETRLDQMADLGPPGSIKVQTLDHVVYLNGLVDGGLEKRTAEEAVLKVPGVEKVADDIDVLHN
jgi:osmotically-inducible protein OsmY